MSSRAFDTLRSGLVGALGILALVPFSASARELWIVAREAEAVLVFDATSQAVVGAPIPVGNDPRSIALTPDGAVAYVANRADNTLSVIDTKTKGVAAPIDLGTFVPNAVAVAPDGSRILVAGTSGLIAVDPATGAVMGTLWQIHAAPPEPADLVLTPDGTHAYAPLDQLDASVSSFDLRTYTGHEVAPYRGDRPDLDCSGCFLRSAAITPDGTRVMIGGDVNGILDTASGSLTRVATPGGGTSGIAVTPDGVSAYAVGGTDALWRYAMPDGGLDNTLVAPDRHGVAITVNPRGDRLYTTFGTVGNYRLHVLERSTHAPVGTPIPMPDIPIAMTFVPNQGPTAAFSTSGATVPGTAVGFDAGSSSDDDGSVARYDWDFGDGITAPDAGPRPTHTYTSPGTFQVTLTATDDEGCSTQRVYTGRTASCNGGAAARAVASVTLSAPAAGSPLAGAALPSAQPLAGDATAPRVRLAGATIQRVGPTIAVAITCDEACTATATGSLTVTTRAASSALTRARRYTLRRVRARLAGGTPRTLRLAVPRVARRLLMRRGARGAVAVRITVTDGAGNARHARRRITLRR